MSQWILNPLSYVYKEQLHFQEGGVVHRVPPELTRLHWPTLRYYYGDLRSSHADPALDSLTPLIDAGVLVPSDKVEDLLRRERIVKLSRMHFNVIYLAMAADRAGIDWSIRHDGRRCVVFFSRARGRHRESTVLCSDGYFLGENRGITAVSAPKMVANHLLASWGVPVPPQLILSWELLRQTPGQPAERNRLLVDYCQLHWPTRRICFPVIVKPAVGSLARGVVRAFDMEDLVVKARDVARRFDQDVVVEALVRGPEWRILMMGSGRYAAYRRYRPSVVGNGRSTVRELMRESYRRRSDLARERRYVRRIPRPVFSARVIDSLRRQGLTPDSIAPVRKRVMLAFTRGGSQETQATTVATIPEAAATRLHELVQRLGGARLGFDMAGGRLGGSPWPRILETNEQPFLDRHEEPDEGPPSGAALMTLDYFLQRGAPPTRLRLLEAQCRRAEGFESPI